MEIKTKMNATRLARVQLRIMLDIGCSDTTSPQLWR
jgi:hypothetical protein